MEILKIRAVQSDIMPSVTIIFLEGALDSNAIGMVSQQIEQITAQGKYYIVAEMSKVTMISSAILGELMGCRKRLIDKNGNLVFANVDFDLKTKLNMIGASKIFKFFNDVRSALNSYSWEYEGKSDTVSVSFPPELKFVPLIRSLVSRVARQKGYNNKDAFRIETIVDEVCNNAVEHGAHVEGKNIDISLAIDRDKIELNVTNLSDPLKTGSLKNLTENISQGTLQFSHERRGRGLALIKMLSSKLQIDCSETGTIVHVTKLRED